MDQDRSAGGAKKVTGKIKEMVGKATGNRRLEAEGKADQVAGTTQNTVGKTKDAGRDVRDTLKR